MKRSLLLLSLFLSGCTLGGQRVRRESPDTERVTELQCDWGEGNWLSQGYSPNSPLFPFHRGKTRRFDQKVLLNIVTLGAPLVFDAVLSPLAYVSSRECRETGSFTRYVPDKKETAERKRREAEQERAARRAREELDRKLRAEQELRLAEERRAAEALAAEFPPLDDAPSSRPRRPNDFAVVVGIENYRSIPKADYGEADAKRARGYLEALGVPPQNIILLTGQSASRADLAKYLEEWLPANTTPESRVYFYYSGHGAPDPATGSAYLVPWDGDPAFPKSTGYALSKVYETLGSLPAKESVVMLDSCFSGAGGRSVLAPGTRPLVTVQSDAPPSKVSVLAASGPAEIAGGLELRKSGLFTYYLLRGLSGAADGDGDKSLTLGELRSYLTGEVPKAARRSNRDQTPRVLGDPALKLY